MLACGSKTPTPTTRATTGDATPASDTPAVGDDDPTKCERGRCLEDISPIVQTRRADARACYDTATNRRPAAAGIVIINFEIDPDGRVADASQGAQDGQLDDAEMVGCIVGVIKQLRFAKSARGKTTRAYHRFDFTPK